MTALITELLEGPDNSEVIRDQIAGILLLELPAQMVLAAALGKDTAPYDLEVYTARADPWSSFDAEDASTAQPFINVSFESDTFSQSDSAPAIRQTATGLYNIDCYACGVSTETVDGHDPGDAAANISAQAVAGTVRRILTHSAYTYLGLRGVVGQRWPGGITMNQQQRDNQQAVHVAAARFSLDVKFNEFSGGAVPEVCTPGLITIQRASHTGQVYLLAQYPAGD